VHRVDAAARRWDREGVVAYGMNGVDASGMGARRQGWGLRSGGSEVGGGQMEADVGRRRRRGWEGGIGHGRAGKGRAHRVWKVAACGGGRMQSGTGGYGKGGVNGQGWARRVTWYWRRRGGRRSGWSAQGTGSEQGQYWKRARRRGGG
jgi:hypothetical protein